MSAQVVTSYANAMPRVVRGDALGDVGHREVRHDARAVGREAECLAQAVDRPADVVVIEHHALRRTGGARRVDDRRQVVRLGDALAAASRPTGAAESSSSHDSTPVARRRGSIDDHDVRSAAGRRGPRAPGPRNSSPRRSPPTRGVPGQVRDLLRRRGVVDRDRRRAEEEHGDVGHVELGAVAHEHDDPVAGSHAERPQPGRGPGGPVGVLVEGEGADVVADLLPQGDLTAPLGHRVEEPPGNGVGRGHGVTLSTTRGGELRIRSGKPRRDGEEWRQFVPRRSLGRRHVRPSLRRLPRDELASGPARSGPRAEALNATAVAPIQHACSRHARSSRVRWSPCSSSPRPPRSPRSRRPPPRRRPPPPPAPPPPPRPTRRRPRSSRSRIPDAFAALANQVSQNQQMLTQLSAQVDQATQRLAALTAEIDATQQKLDATRVEMARLRADRARARRVHLPPRRHAQHRGRRHPARPGHQRGRRSTRSRRRRPTTARSTGLQKVSDQLDARNASSSKTSRASQQEEKDRLENAKQALEALTAHQKKLLDQAGAIPVMGDAELTPAEVTAWFEARNVKYRLSGGISIGDLVQIYFEEGKAEHVRPGARLRPVDHRDRVVRQRARQQLRRHRRLRQLPGRDRRSPLPGTACAGQIQLLRNYADPASRAATLANPPSPTIYGNDPVAAASRTTRSSPRGALPPGT